jgi:MSHA biogenesis protein MshK
MVGDMIKGIQTTKTKKQLAQAGAGSSTYLRFAALAFCLLSLSAASADEALRDPTRPPAVLFAPDGGAKTETGPVLQSVLISPGRRTAVISGKSVTLGDQYGDARVVGIKETEVVLKTGSSLQTLKLFPDVEKRSAENIKRSKR